MLKGKSDNFTIYSEGSAASLRKYIEELEQFDAMLKRIYQRPSNENHQPLTIYLLNSSADVSRLLAGTRRANVAGFFSPHMEGSYAVSHRDRARLAGQHSARLTLLHEYMHFFQMRFLPGAFPSWLQEGLSEYFSTTEFQKDGKAVIGKAPYNRAFNLLAEQPIGSEVILLRDAFEIDRDYRGRYYAQSWALTHMFQHETIWSARFGKYVMALNEGVDPKQAVHESLGEFEDIDRALSNYVKGRISYQILAEPLAIPANILIERVDEVKEDLVRLQLERRAAGQNPDRHKQVRTKLARLASLHPENPAILFEHARAMEDGWRLLEEDDGASAQQEVEILALIDHILLLEPQHSRTNLMKGRLHLERLRQQDDSQEEDWKTARSYIVKANRADPKDPLALHAYYQSFIDEGRQVPEIAVDGMEHAFMMAPELPVLRVSYAWSLARTGNFDLAKKTVLVLANDPHDNSYGKAIIQQLEDMKRAGTEVSANAPPPEVEDD